MIREGQEVVPGFEPRLAPGIRGVLFDTKKGVYVPLLLAEKPGSGAVSEWLDTLPKNRRVVFPNVISGKLVEMLLARGFVPGSEQDPMTGDEVELMERGKEPER